MANRPRSTPGGCRQFTNAHVDRLEHRQWQQNLNHRLLRHAHTFLHVSALFGIAFFCPAVFLSQSWKVVCLMVWRVWIPPRIPESGLGMASYHDVLPWDQQMDGTQLFQANRSVYFSLLLENPGFSFPPINNYLWILFFTLSSSCLPPSSVDQLLPPPSEPLPVPDSASLAPWLPLLASSPLSTLPTR